MRNDQAPARATAVARPLTPEPYCPDLKQREGARKSRPSSPPSAWVYDSGLMLGQIVERVLALASPRPAGTSSSLVDANTIVKRGRAYIAITRTWSPTPASRPDPTLGVKMAPADPPPWRRPRPTPRPTRTSCAARAARDAFNAGQEAKARLNQRTRENAEANIRGRSGTSAPRSATS